MGKILIVEDDAAVRDSLAEILRTEGYDVTTYKNAEGVPQLLGEERFDVVITDLKMPGINGMELIRSIRKKPIDCEIMIITGYGTMESAIDALELGVYDYITKPFEPVVIMNTVGRALEKVKLRRQKAEADEVIRSLKDFNEEILESSPQATVVVDRDIVCRYWNSAAERLSGIKRERVIGKDLIREKVWILGKNVPKEFQAALNGNVAEKTVTVTSPRKRDFALRQKLTPLRDADGRVKGVLVFLTDITRTKAAAKRKDDIKRQNDHDLARVSCLYNISRDSETATSIGSFLDLSVNHILDSLGRRNGVKARIAFDGKVYGSIKSDLSDDVFSAEIDTGLLGKGELRVYAEDRGLTAKQKKLLNSAAELIGEIVSARDKAGQVAEAERMASLGRLAGGLAHNLNNILGGILGYTSYIKSEIPSDSPLHAHLCTIEESSSLAADMTSQLLEISGSQTASKHHLDINGSIERVIGLMQILFDRNVVITSKLEPELHTVTGDISRLDLMMIYMCMNAREALSAGGRLSIVTCNVEIKEGEKTADLKPGRYVQISFKDTGVGMDEDAVRHCFDPFYSTKGLGHGLGLSTSYGIVRAHGGHIQISSKPGFGTTVRVHLPAAQKAASRKKSTAPKKGGKVLVVDDEGLIRKMVFDVLGKLGYEVMLASDGTEAVSMLQRKGKGIDVVLLDYVMPGKDFQNVYDELKEAKEDVEIIVSSGYRLPAEARKVVSEKGALFIKKPYTLQELSEVMQRALKPR